MLFRTRSSRTCTCAQFLHSVAAVACAAARLESAQMSRRWTEDALPLGVAGQAKPLLVRAGQTTKDGHTACRAAGIAQPIPVAMRTWEWTGGLSSAAWCRDGARTANTAAGEDRSGS